MVGVIKTALAVALVGFLIGSVVSIALRAFLSLPKVKRFIQRYYQVIKIYWELSKFTILVYLWIYARHITQGTEACFYFILQLAKRIGAA